MIVPIISSLDDLLYMWREANCRIEKGELFPLPIDNDFYSGKENGEHLRKPLYTYNVFFFNFSIQESEDENEFFEIDSWINN